MNKMTWSICLVIIFLCTPVFGEFYKFVDENGNVKYTDDLNKVPEEQRPKAKTYIESVGITEEEADVSDVKKKETTSDSTAELDQIKMQLDQDTVELKKEYDAMMKEQKALAEEQEKAKTRILVKQHNKKVVVFNEKAAQYATKRKALDERVNEFNSAVKEDLENKLKKMKKK